MCQATIARLHLVATLCARCAPAAPWRLMFARMLRAGVLGSLRPAPLLVDGRLALLCILIGPAVDVALSFQLPPWPRRFARVPVFWPALILLIEHILIRWMVDVCAAGWKLVLIFFHETLADARCTAICQ